MFRNWVLVIVLYALAPPGVCGERFNGSGKLTETPATSNERFRLHAELTTRPAGATQKASAAPAPSRAPEMLNGRFGLSARFTNAIAGSLCGLAPTENIFANGFEN